MTKATVDVQAEVGTQTHGLGKAFASKPGSCLAALVYVFTWKGELRVEALDLCEVS